MKRQGRVICCPEAGDSWAVLPSADGHACRKRGFHQFDVVRYSQLGAQGSLPIRHRLLGEAETLGDLILPLAAQNQPQYFKIQRLQGLERIIGTGHLLDGQILGDRLAEDRAGLAVPCG